MSALLLFKRSLGWKSSFAKRDIIHAGHAGPCLTCWAMLGYAGPMPMSCRGLPGLPELAPAKTLHTRPLPYRTLSPVSDSELGLLTVRNAAAGSFHRSTSRCSRFMSSSSAYLRVSLHISSTQLEVQPTPAAAG